MMKKFIILMNIGIPYKEVRPIFTRNDSYQIEMLREKESIL